MVADMVAFVASQFTTSTWDVGAQELCSVVLIKKQAGTHVDRDRQAAQQLASERSTTLTSLLSFD